MEVAAPSRPQGTFSVLVSVQVPYQIRLVLEVRRRESLTD